MSVESKKKGDCGCSGGGKAKSSDAAPVMPKKKPCGCSGSDPAPSAGGKKRSGSAQPSRSTRGGVSPVDKVMETTLAVLERGERSRSPLVDAAGFVEYDTLHSLTPRQGEGSRFSSDYYARPTHQHWDNLPVVNAHSTPMRGSAGIPSLSEAGSDANAAVELAKHMLRERLGVDELPSAEDLPALINQQVSSALNQAGRFVDSPDIVFPYDNSGVVFQEALDTEDETGSDNEDDASENDGGAAENIMAKWVEYQAVERLRKAMDEQRKHHPCPACEKDIWEQLKKEWKESECEVSADGKTMYCPNRNEPQYIKDLQGHSYREGEVTYTEVWYAIDPETGKLIQCRYRNITVKNGQTLVGYDGCMGKSWADAPRLDGYSDFTGKVYVDVRHHIPTEPGGSTFPPVFEIETDFPEYRGEPDCAGCEWCPPPDVIYVDKPWYGWVQVGTPGGQGLFDWELKIYEIRRDGSERLLNEVAAAGNTYQWNESSSAWENVDYPPGPEQVLPDNEFRHPTVSPHPIGRIKPAKGSLRCGHRRTVQIGNYNADINPGALPRNRWVRVEYWVNNLLCRTKLVETKYLERDCEEGCANEYDDKDSDQFKHCKAACTLSTLHRGSPEWAELLEEIHQARRDAWHESGESAEEDFAPYSLGLELACNKVDKQFRCSFAPLEVRQKDYDNYTEVEEEPVLGKIKNFGGVCGKGNKTAFPDHPVAKCCATHDLCYQQHGFSSKEWANGAMCKADLRVLCKCDKAAIDCWLNAAEEVLEDPSRDTNWQAGVRYAISAACLFGEVNKRGGQCDWHAEVAARVTEIKDKYAEEFPGLWKWAVAQFMPNFLLEEKWYTEEWGNRGLAEMGCTELGEYLAANLAR